MCIHLTKSRIKYLLWQMRKVKSAGTASQMRTSRSWFTYLWSHQESDSETMSSLTTQNTRPAEWRISRPRARESALVMPYIKDEEEALRTRKRRRTDALSSWTSLNPSSGFWTDHSFQHHWVTFTTAEKQKKTTDRFFPGSGLQDCGETM